MCNSSLTFMILFIYNFILLHQLTLKMEKKENKASKIFEIGNISKHFQQVILEY